MPGFALILIAFFTGMILFLIFALIGGSLGFVFAKNNINILAYFEKTKISWLKPEDANNYNPNQSSGNVSEDKEEKTTKEDTTSSDSAVNSSPQSAPDSTSNATVS